MFRILILLFLYFRVNYSNSTQDDFEIANRIDGRSRCSIEDHPYMIGLMLAKSGIFVCGGSLLSAFWVITARHCIDYCEIPNFYMVIGGLEIIAKLQWGSNVQVSMVKSCHHNNKKVDFALINLKSPMKVSKTVGYVKLAAATDVNVLDTDLSEICANSTVVGWGVKTAMSISSSSLDFNHRFNPHLQCMQTSVIPTKICDRLMKSISVNIKQVSYFCTFKKNVDACLADSGGPLICRGLQYGIITSGFGCAIKNYPGVYVAAPSLDTFIKSVFAEVSKNHSLNIDSERKCASTKNSFLVAIIHLSNSKMYEVLCAGSMIAKTWVLTAGSCTTRCKSLTVIGGLGNPSKYNSRDSHALSSQVKNCFRFSKKSSAYDIAIMKLKKGFNPSNKLSFVKFATDTPAFYRTFGVVCGSGMIIGYGPQKRDEMVRNLQCARAVVASQERCKIQWNSTEIGRQHSCVLAKIVESCYGMLGAPLICEGIQYGVLVDIACDGCRNLTPILIAKVYEYNKFLRKISEKSKGILNNLVNLYILFFSAIVLFSINE